MHLNLEQIRINYGKQDSILAQIDKIVDEGNGKTVFLDAFSGFSGQEYKVIEQILRQADDVFVTFCCDTSKNNDRYELFYFPVCCQDRFCPK